MTEFSAATQQWFDGAFPAPTDAQLGAWRAIAAGEHTLVIAPTGSGKTLSAFLWAIDELARADPPVAGTSVLYISPLKALAVDVERNLRAPLVGVRQTARRLGLPAPEISVGVRSGDTPAQERRRLQRTPPNILITTPESLFLMLTSAARETLRGVRTVIVDEVHAIAGSKRGSHLALSLARLDTLTDRPAQRIGLSATVRPPAEVGKFLVGQAPITIVSPPAPKTFDLSVRVPVADMTEPGDSGQPGSLWPHVDESIVELVLTHRSSIVFANSRRLAERLTARLNETYAEQLGEGPDTVHAPPAQLGPSTEVTHGAAPLLARAHHGSVSKEQRALIEDDLKSGRLRCVVATSSLELGIDMGAVDLVVQVEAPPSVASGLQRIGRAGHQVGEISRGVLFPKHRTDVVHCAVAAQRMLAGQIEELKIPAHPLDILAQQTVAACALEPLDVDTWFGTVRGTGSYAALPRSSYEAVLDLLAGRYPSDEFAELRPRLVWDRDAGTLTGRPGAQRLAVTSGGAIPDRGMFAVYMVGEKASRVGELDEEMVYESRVGDVFALGATSWRIEDITYDRVLVTPAFGHPGRLPFWHGDSLGRPAELGAALGEFVRKSGSDTASGDFTARTTAAGLDENAVANLRALLDDQRTATGRLPTDRTLVVERFRDELGDWRLILHSPYGMPVHAAWALAIGARLRERFGVDASPNASDDGIVVRLPDTTDDPPGAELFVFEPDEIDEIVTEQVGGSALFASRFRECSARALLLPRRDPGKRAPLWQQRQRSAQLLDVARKFPDFPILLETVRECLRDVYDLPALRDLLGRVARRQIRLVEVETATPSPFANALLFDYIGQFMYDGDSPLAERRAAALSLDSSLLAELLGRVELRELLDSEIIGHTEQELQRLTPERKARDAEGLADLLRLLGPLTADEAGQRCREDPADWFTELADARRALEVTYAGRVWWAAIEDAARLRDALGVPLPIGTPAAFIEPVPDPLGDLVARFARTHGPFGTEAVARRFGLGSAVAASALHQLVAEKRVVEGEFTPETAGSEWCDTQVLRRLRRRSLAAARHEIEPVSTAALARFLPDWQHIGSGELRGIDGVAAVVDQLAGVPVPASAWESLVLPARVRDYTPGMLDELMATGEVRWSGHGVINAKDGWIALHPSDQAPLTLPPPDEPELDELHLALLTALGAEPAAWSVSPTGPAAGQATAAGKQLWSPAGSAAERDTAGGRLEPSSPTAGSAAGRDPADGQVEPSSAGSAAGRGPAGARVEPDRGGPLMALRGGGGAYFFRQLADATGVLDDTRVASALWDLVWAGLISGDTFAPVRARLSGATRTPAAHRTPRRAPRGRAYLPRPAMPTRSGPPTVAGRWSMLPERALDNTVRAHATADLLLERYGVVTKGAVQNEGMPGGFALAYRVLSEFEDRGRCRRGYFVDSLGGAQFSTTDVVDRLRSFEGDRRPAGPALVLAACDPANPYGAALGWPKTAGGAGHRPGRKAGALVVLVDGELVLYLERGGRTLLTCTEDPAARHAAATALAGLVRSGQVDSLVIDRVDGESVHGNTFAGFLTEAGFSDTPRGLRLRGRR
ncbi:ATP-dependent helicase [Nocardia speluncae]|uniref:ATP-dependent helicase n=1 Tax=Nocardia speluncae TaxID=419477 RepID=A0A846XNZ5_9NOCA|nr:ATP-dependent helicase [Nocardia speluncae]NKY37025.1 ATP-dependent helicase [Nocardia speluncae]